MADVELVFTPEKDNEYFPKPLSGKYKLVSLEINASDLDGLLEAIRQMKIYFRFDYGSKSGENSKTIPLSNYVIGIDTKDYIINFRTEEIVSDPKKICTNIHVAIINEVLAPVTKMTLTLNKV